MSEEDSGLEKTEAPTPHKLEKARTKGDVARSRELTSMFMLGAGLGLLWIVGESMARQLVLVFAQGLRFDHDILSDDRRMITQTLWLLAHALLALLPVLGGLVLVALLAPTLLSGFLFSTEALKFNLNRLNPVTGFKRIFSGRIFAELLKAILKVTLVWTIAGLFLWVSSAKILHLVAEPLMTALGHAMSLIVFCGLFVVAGLMPMVVFDVFYQVISHTKKLRMTKQEIRDEHKDHDGDPQIKARIRQLQRAFARKRMMSDVPKADVIVTNPTHYAVALQYKDKKMNAPKVLAKGAGEIALRIRELGAEHRVPLLEAPSLARALYRHSEIGQHIPTTLYAAVAEVLAWVYQLKRWQREGGLIPQKPKNLPVPEALDIVGESDTHG